MMGHSPCWRAAMRVGSKLQEMARVTGSSAVDESVRSARSATSLSSVKLLTRLSVSKISNSAVLDEEGSFAIDDSNRINAIVGRDGTGTSRTSFQNGMTEVCDVDTACQGK